MVIQFTAMSSQFMDNSTIRKMEVELSVTHDIETIVLAAFASISKEDCEAWIGYNDIFQ